jgi:hypothetical protein
MKQCFQIHLVAWFAGKSFSHIAPTFAESSAAFTIVFGERGLSLSTLDEEKTRNGI